MGGNGRLLLRRARSQQTLLLAVLAVALVGTTVLGRSRSCSPPASTTCSPSRSTGPRRRRPGDRRHAHARARATPRRRGRRTGHSFLDEPARRRARRPRGVALVGDVHACRAPTTASPRTPTSRRPRRSRRAARSSAGRFPTSGVDDQGRVLSRSRRSPRTRTAGRSAASSTCRGAASRDARRVRRHRHVRAHGTGRDLGPRRARAARSTTPPIPCSGPPGCSVTQAWGPFVVGDPAVLTDGTARLGVAHLVAHPGLAHAGAGAVDGLRQPPRRRPAAPRGRHRRRRARLLRRDAAPARRSTPPRAACRSRA